MKRVILMLALALLLVPAAAMADTITGSVDFGGLATLNTGQTGVTTWTHPIVENSTLSGPGLSYLDPATIHATWFFNSGPINNFWQAGSYKFNLTSSAGGVVGPYINASGTGFITDDGGETYTAGSWVFTMQSGSSGKFSFSATSTAAPEPASMALLGSGLLGLGAMFRRKR